MAYDNAQMAAALGALLNLDPAETATLADDLDQWALGGARLATWSRLATDVTLFNNAAVAMVHDWYGGTATGGPNGDGTYPLMNSEGETYMVPSPARLQADLTGFDPSGSVATVADLPATGEPGDLWTIASTGDAWGWSTRQQSWRNMGPFRGPIGATGAKGDTGSQGPKGDTGATGAKGDTGSQGPQGDVGPKGDAGPKGDQGPQGVKGDRGEAFTVDAQGTLAGRAAYDTEAVGFSYLDDQNGNLYFRIASGGWSPPIPFGKGDKGDPGEAGPAGPAGPAGADGAPGAAGATGATGPKGDKGDTGSQGPAGPKGDTGATGAKGDTGATGPAGPSAFTVIATIPTTSGTAIDITGIPSTYEEISLLLDNVGGNNGGAVNLTLFTQRAGGAWRGSGVSLGSVPSTFSYYGVLHPFRYKEGLALALAEYVSTSANQTDLLFTLDGGSQTKIVLDKSPAGPLTGLRLTLGGSTFNKGSIKVLGR